MQRPVCLADFEVHFKNSLNKNVLDYYSSGANQEQTLKDNMEAFTRYVSTVMHECFDAKDCLVHIIVEAFYKETFMAYDYTDGFIVLLFEDTHSTNSDT